MSKLFPRTLFIFTFGAFAVISTYASFSLKRGVLFVAAAESMMALCVSLVVVAGALIVILFPKRFDPTAEKWAYGALSAVVGYWLRP